MRRVDIAPHCFGLRSLLPFGLPYLVRRVRDAGADGTQAYPFLFWSERAINFLDPSFIGSYTHAWNLGYLCNTFANKERLKRDGWLGLKSLALDIGLFGGIAGFPKRKFRLIRELFPEALAVDTGIPGDALETQPDGDDTWTHSGPVVIDLFHILERNHFSETDTMIQIESIKERCVRIEFQMRGLSMTSDLLEQFFDQSGYLHNALQSIVRDKPNVPILIEVSEKQLRTLDRTMSELTGALRKY